MIVVAELTRSYGDFKAVDSVSFSIGHGEIVGLLGHNGAGKTTIMKMLTGYLEPSAGSIHVDGLDIASHRREVQHKIGYLPENCPLYLEMTVIDFLEYQAGLHGVAEHDRLSAVHDAIERTELSSKATQTMAVLSRGYRQRVGVAQALLHRPQILILDEPTNGLDPSQIQHMRGLIRDLSRQATVILSTHILQEVQAVCDRVLILRNGAMAMDARLEELSSSRRLLVALDAGPDKAQSPLAALAGVQAVEHLGRTAGRHRYALSLSADEADPAELAPGVARSLLDQGYALYNLQPEQRDLETVFGEISEAAAREVAHG
jgi:ABC-2 type transport system ATP-binding protein